MLPPRNNFRLHMAYALFMASLRVLNSSAKALFRFVIPVLAAPVPFEVSVGKKMPVAG